MRKGEASIVLHDLGPVSPAAMQREILRIEALWLGGNAAGAQTRVKRLSAIASRHVQEPQRRPLLNTMLPLLESGCRSPAGAGSGAALRRLEAGHGRRAACDAGGDRGCIAAGRRA